jgi:hypothetical protein
MECALANGLVCYWSTKYIKDSKEGQDMSKVLTDAISLASFYEVTSLLRYAVFYDNNEASELVVKYK